MAQWASIAARVATDVFMANTGVTVSSTRSTSHRHTGGSGVHISTHTHIGGHTHHHHNRHHHTTHHTTTHVSAAPTNTGTAVYNPHVSSSVVVNEPVGAPKAEQIRRLLNEVENTVCGECTAPSPQNISVSFGVFLCGACAAAHRAVLLEACSVDEKDPDISKLVEMGGNAGNTIYEHSLATAEKSAGRIRPTPDASETIRKKFIRRKYVDQEWWKPNATVALKLVDDDSTAGGEATDDPFAATSTATAPAPQSAAAAYMNAAKAAPAPAPEPKKKVAPASSAGTSTRKPVAAPVTAPKSSKAPKSKAPAAAPVPVPAQVPAETEADPWAVDPFAESDPFDAPPPLMATAITSAPGTARVNATASNQANATANPGSNKPTVYIPPASTAGASTASTGGGGSLLGDDDFMAAFSAATISKPAPAPVAAPTFVNPQSPINYNRANSSAQQSSPAMYAANSNKSTAAAAASPASWADFAPAPVPLNNPTAYGSNMPNALARGVPNSGGGGGGGYNLADFASNVNARPTYAPDSLDELSGPGFTAQSVPANSFLYASNYSRPNGAGAGTGATSTNKPVSIMSNAGASRPANGGGSELAAFEGMFGGRNNAPSAAAPASVRFPQPPIPAAASSSQSQPSLAPYAMAPQTQPVNRHSYGQPQQQPQPYGNQPSNQLQLPPWGGGSAGSGAGANPYPQLSQQPQQPYLPPYGYQQPQQQPQQMMPPQQQPYLNQPLQQPPHAFGMAPLAVAAPASNAHNLYPQLGGYGQPPLQAQQPPWGQPSLAEPYPFLPNNNASAAAAPPASSAGATRGARTGSVDLPALDNSSVMSFFNSVSAGKRTGGAAAPAPPSNGGTAPANPFAGNSAAPSPPAAAGRDIANPFAALDEL